MTDLVLAKADLPEGTIDAAVGEPHIVRANLFDTFDMEALTPVIKDFNLFEYTKPAGYDPLVKFLENKHQAPVIISNGAKQSVGSVFYALKKAGKNKINMPSPWWSLFPPLIKMHGLEHCGLPLPFDDSAELVVYPNNPDGGGLEYLDQKLIDAKNAHGIPTIHDAAYFSKIYLGEDIPKIGTPNVQIYTCSKLLGLSQLRVGYAVYHDTQLYKDALSYMEHMTVGVSILSQMYAYNILKEIEDNPEKTDRFETNCYIDIALNKAHASEIPSDILEPSGNPTGMFLWTKCYNLDAFKNNKINVVEGTPFGMPGYIRMNVAIPEKTMIEVVDRLNQ